MKNQYNFNKNSNKTTKNSKKHNNFYQFKQNFEKEIYDWLGGIQEDNPIPLEVNYIYFCFDFSQNDIAISYSGDENLLEYYTLGFYAPLEAQYFYSGTLKTISNYIFENKKEKLLNSFFDFLKEILLSVSQKLWFLKDKKIFVGTLFDKIK